MERKLEKLANIAKRISEIGDEIRELKHQREVNLMHCHASDDTDFGSQRGIIDPNLPYRENCLNVAYRWAKEEFEQCMSYGEIYNTESFYHILLDEGCINCKSAYKAKKSIGKLKKERGRLIGNISRIGKAI